MTAGKQREKKKEVTPPTKAQSLNRIFEVASTTNAEKDNLYLLQEGKMWGIKHYFCGNLVSSPQKPWKSCLATSEAEHKGRMRHREGDGWKASGC